MVAKRNGNIVEDNWLSHILGYSVYRIVVDSSFIKKINNRKSREYDEFYSLLKRHVFLYCKIANDDIKGINFLEKHGFYLVDTNIIFEKDIEVRNVLPKGYNVRFAEDSDETGVTNLAGKSFTYSRFHLDSNISDDIANTIKAEWARNYFRGTRGDSMIVAENGDAIIGFLQLLYGPVNQLIIDLIAVEKDHRKQGVARDMIVYAEKNCGNFHEIRVGTQLANTASIRFYENIGFRYISSQYVFHYMH